MRHLNQSAQRPFNTLEKVKAALEIKVDLSTANRNTPTPATRTEVNSSEQMKAMSLM